MSLSSTHPEYSEALDNWTSMRDFQEGEVAVKAKGVTYLPPTTGMQLDGMTGTSIGLFNYNNYKSRAVFPDYVAEGVEALMGLIHQHDAKFKLPKSMEYLLNEATYNGESLLMLLRKINEEQLITGRVGLLVDIPKNPDPLKPKIYLSLYAAETIINWDDGVNAYGESELNMVVLNETANVRDGFTWKMTTMYRVLQLGLFDKNEENAIYRQGLFEDEDYSDGNLAIPMFRGKPLNKIPFVFINTKDLRCSPDMPPLLGLGKSCLSIYRSEADYRQNLHMQGQDTLVTVGGVRNSDAAPGEEGAIRVGAGSRIDVDMGGDAKFIGVSSLGLLEQRNAIENDRKRAEFKAGQLIGNQSLKNESGSAMIARLASQTANLNQISLTGGEGLEKALKFIAEWLGENPNEVEVLPNTEFTNAAANAQELVYLMTARSMGAPLSMQSIHTTLRERNYTNMDYEEEKNLVEEEGPNGQKEIAVDIESDKNLTRDDKSKSSGKPAPKTEPEL